MSDENMAKRVWWLQCNHCGFRLPDGAAASPKCPECGDKIGENMHVHSRPVVEELVPVQ